MTFIVGLRCRDGLVIGADSLESDGIVKRRVNKIYRMPAGNWELAIAGSGGGGIVEKFTREIKATLPAKPIDHYAVENFIEQTLAEFKLRYREREDQFSVLVGMFNKADDAYHLYRADSVVLAPVDDEAHIGTGNELWRLLCDALYRKKNSVQANIRIASFATRMAIHYSEGVDEPIQVVFYTAGQKAWKVLQGTELEIALRMRPEPGNIAEIIRNWWKEWIKPYE